MKKLHELIHKWEDADDKNFDSLLSETKTFLNDLYGSFYEVLKMIHFQKYEISYHCSSKQDDIDFQNYHSETYKIIIGVEEKLRELTVYIHNALSFLSHLNPVNIKANVFEITKILNHLESYIKEEEELFSKIRSQIAKSITRQIQYLHLIENEGKSIDLIRKKMKDLR